MADGLSKWDKRKGDVEITTGKSLRKDVERMKRSRPRSGDDFEEWLRDFFPEVEKAFSFRIPESGRLGDRTAMDDPQLQGDVVFDWHFFPKRLRIEAKHGYGTDKYATLDRDVLDKIALEASLAGDWPGNACKINHKVPNDPVIRRTFLVFPLDVFAKLICVPVKVGMFTRTGLTAMLASSEFSFSVASNLPSYAGNVQIAKGRTIRITRLWLDELCGYAAQLNALPVGIVQWPDGERHAIVPWTTFMVIKEKAECAKL